MQMFADIINDFRKRESQLTGVNTNWNVLGQAHLSKITHAGLDVANENLCFMVAITYTKTNVTKL